MTADRPTVGQKIKAKAIVEGKHKLLPGGKKRQWVRKERDIDGVYMGYRTVQEGRLVKEYDDFGGYYNLFVPDRYLEVWLIVVDPRQNPVRVLPEDVTEKPYLEIKVLDLWDRDNPPSFEDRYSSLADVGEPLRYDCCTADRSCHGGQHLSGKCGPGCSEWEGEDE